jgi:polyphosphate kinase 2 (PPK2 family)
VDLSKAEVMQRIQAELQDAYDEEIELEFEDRALEQLDRSKLRGASRESVEAHAPEAALPRSEYFRELFKLQHELVRLQDWVVRTGHRMVILFEGRDAAGKGGVIKRIAQRLNPRVTRVVALPAPNDREKTQWYFQRFVAHLGVKPVAQVGGAGALLAFRGGGAVRLPRIAPVAGEIVLFDRSWYNRAGVERVMGFCTAEQLEQFFRDVPEFERMLVRSGIQLLKYWFSISDEEQHLRFLARMHDPLKQWKLSPMDLESRRRWEDYTRAKEDMLERTHIAEARWWIVHAVDKKRARLNCIHHLLGEVPYQSVEHPTIALPDREHHEDYRRQHVPPDMVVPDFY